MDMNGRRQADDRWSERRRSKARMTLRLAGSTRIALMAAARERGIPASELAERLIRAGLERGAARQMEDTAMPAIVQAVLAALDEHERRGTDRLAKLLVRSIVAGDTTRRLLFAHMARRWGGADAIHQVHEAARLGAINALRDRGWAAALRLDIDDAMA
jgi:hypothetical protein